MSERDKLPQQDYSKFVAMSTDKLEEILRLDAQLPEGETPDPDAILYIMEVLAKRERESKSENAPDVEAAWQIFNQQYRPYTADDTSLYEDDDTNNEMDSYATIKDIQDAPLTSASRPGRKWGRAGFRMGFAAMIAVVVLVAGTATASALGLNIWDALARWTGEVFEFSAEQEESPAVRQLNALKHDMEERGITGNVLPTYLPEGYEVVNTKCQEKEAYIKFDCLLSNGKNSIIFIYRLHLTGYYSGEFEKTLNAPEEYEAGGITHFIMNNADTYVVAWMCNDVECSITGVGSVEEARKMIDSIYGA